MDLKKIPTLLSQPAKGFRFAIDSLLLASFAQPKKNWKILDAGCGCGVIGIGVLLKNYNLNIKVWAMDIDITQISHLKTNKQLTNNNFFPFIADIKEATKLFKKGEFFDQILLNPPYRALGTGKLSPYTTKNKAKFEQITTLEEFIKGIKFLLKNKGELVICYLSEYLDYLIKTLDKNKIQIKEVQFIHPRQNKEAKIFLAKAIKNANPGLKVLPPLILYSHPKKNIYTTEIKNMCPFLA